MKKKCLNIFFLVLLNSLVFIGYGQNTPENLKVALVYKIANYIKWAPDTLPYFIIGVLSNDKLLIDRFNELATLTKINKRNIKVYIFKSNKQVQQVHLLYVDPLYNDVFSDITKKTARQNTLLISEEFPNAGEIMINLKLDKSKERLTFEYNRANILFHGLELNEKIVLLKGSEIEIRELYLQVKKLWDEQKAQVDSLKIQSAIQNQNLKTQKDSNLLMKKNIRENKATIDEQLLLISQKDLLSNKLNLEIKNQKSEKLLNKKQIDKFLSDQHVYEGLIEQHKMIIDLKQKQSDSLTKDIQLKEKELIEKKKALKKKESVIQKQFYGLIFSFLLISIVLISAFIIYRAYLFNKRAKQQISEQKEELETTLDRLKRTQQQLLRSEKMASLGVLVAGVAHEINNPLNFISSGIEGIDFLIKKMCTLIAAINQLKPNENSKDMISILKLKEDLRIHESLEMMDEVLGNINIGLKRTIEITNGLRLYSRINKEEKSLYDINKILNTALLLMKSRTDNHIEVITEFGDLVPAMVLPGKLSQVFINLFSNAIDSINERIEKNNLNAKPSIWIKTKAINKNIIVEIADNGMGILTENIDKIFDPFYTTKPVGKGVGLGLSITLGIIEEHEGKIFVRNNIPFGAIFSIEIPI